MTKYIVNRLVERKANSALQEVWTIDEYAIKRRVEVWFKAAIALVSAEIERSLIALVKEAGVY